MSETAPSIFSSALGNMGQIKGFDVDMAKRVVQETLGWTYEFHVYGSYSSAFYAMSKLGNCDVTFGPFNSYIERVQCHATPAAGESWGHIMKGCPMYMNPSNATTTDSFWKAACCGYPLTPHLKNGLAVIAEAHSALLLWYYPLSWLCLLEGPTVWIHAEDV